MLRKATSLLAKTVALSLLTIVCELVVLNLGRAPAQAVAGAAPLAFGWQAHRAGTLAPVVSSLLYPPGRVGPVEWGMPAGRAAASSASVRKTSLRRAPTFGQLLRQGRYASRTSPNSTRSILGRAKASARAKAPTLLLGMTMLVAVYLAARRRAAVRAEAPAKPDVPRGDTRVIAREPMVVLQLRRLIPGPIVPRLRDQIAEWERVRLVPT